MLLPWQAAYDEWRKGYPEAPELKNLPDWVRSALENVSAQIIQHPGSRLYIIDECINTVRIRDLEGDLCTEGWRDDAWKEAFSYAAEALEMLKK